MISHFYINFTSAYTSRTSEPLSEKQLQFRQAFRTALLYICFENLAKRPCLWLNFWWVFYVMRLISPGGQTAIIRLFTPPLLKQPHTGIICCSPLSQQYGEGSTPQQLDLTLFNNNGHNLYNKQQRSFYVHEQQTARNSVGTSGDSVHLL